MAAFEIRMPKLGESIIEATITRWLKNVGEHVNEDDALVEIATDKVDSEIPSPVEGLLNKIYFNEGDIVPVGEIIAEIEVAGEQDSEIRDSVQKDDDSDSNRRSEGTLVEQGNLETYGVTEYEKPGNGESFKGRFLSPLIISIIKSEGITDGDIQKIKGSGKDGRLTKRDLLEYLRNRDRSLNLKENAIDGLASSILTRNLSGNDQIIEMDRMRRLIADHMVMSVKVSPHVTSFIEADMTRIVKWRESAKSAFEEREGEKLTYTPIFIEAAARALRDFPGVNASVDGYSIIIRGKVNIGMATVLPNGNLIVPVINDADQKNLSGLSKVVNDLAGRARSNQLKPDEIQGGTFTITNLGTFGSITGTPVINQPQVAILAVGAIKKMPAVVETPEGDMIAVRHKMILALTYDHRVVDGSLGGLFLKKVAYYLENFDTNRVV